MAQSEQQWGTNCNNGTQNEQQIGTLRLDMQPLELVIWVLQAPCVVLLHGEIAC